MLRTRHSLTTLYENKALKDLLTLPKYTTKMKTTKESDMKILKNSQRRKRRKCKVYQKPVEKVKKAVITNLKRLKRVPVRKNINTSPRAVNKKSSVQPEYEKERHKILTTLKLIKKSRSTAKNEPKLKKQQPIAETYTFQPKINNNYLVKKDSKKMRGFKKIEQNGYNLFYGVTPIEERNRVWKNVGGLEWNSTRGFLKT